MYEVTIRKSFAAAHLLREIGGKCEELHGHNFIVEISAAAAGLNEEGLLIDFRLLKRWTSFFQGYEPFVRTDRPFPL
jgi:6-pyruvoyltetrahydropterin/6-carboxytetrahydropterin synthase